MTPRDLRTLVRAGVLQVTARHGTRVEYALTPAGAALVRKPAGRPKPVSLTQWLWRMRAERKKTEQ